MGATTFYLLEQEKKKNNKIENIKKEKVVDYETMTVKELKELAKEKEIDGYYNMKKEELIKALKG